MKIQVLIAAYGPEALEKIAALQHASFPGVEYLIGWQRYDRKRIPSSIADREDFRIIFEESVGLCNNRNELLKASDADVAVIADDDLTYSEDNLGNIVRGFENNPDCDFLSFQYRSDSFPKSYPDCEFNFSSIPKGFFVTSMELAFNMRKIRRDFSGDAVGFNPAFGVNGTFFSHGEEDILIRSMLKKGLKGKFVPMDICTNTDSTTADRTNHTENFIETKGAVFRYLHPSSRYLRMVLHAWRAHSEVPFLSYCRWWLRGERIAVKNKVFR